MQIEIEAPKGLEGYKSRPGKYVLKENTGWHLNFQGTGGERGVS